MIRGPPRATRTDTRLPYTTLFRAEHAAAGEVARDGVLEMPPFDGGIIAEEMVRRGLDPVEVDVVEPLAERLHALADLVGGQTVQGAAHDPARSVARPSSAVCRLRSPIASR